MFVFILSFLTEVANSTFELSFGAGVPQVCSHSVVALKGIWVAATEYASVRRSLVFCKMSSCIKILEAPIAANSRAVEGASLQVVVNCSGDFTTLKDCSASGARWISCQPGVNTSFAHQFFALAALFRLPNHVCTNRANVVVLGSVTDSLICWDLHLNLSYFNFRWHSCDLLFYEVYIWRELWRDILTRFDHNFISINSKIL
jgi:hypothetical protein